MADAPKRRLLDQFGTSPTIIAEGCRFIGDLHTQGALVLSGFVQGNGRVTGALSIARTAQWHGDVIAEYAIVAGLVHGNIAVDEKLEIGNTAVIRGSVRARALAIAHGAVIEGDIAVTSDQPIVRFEEKRHVEDARGPARSVD